MLLLCKVLFYTSYFTITLRINYEIVVDLLVVLGVLVGAARLLQRGGKTLKDRTRTTQVDARLDDLSKDIARIRRELATKPS